MFERLKVVISLASRASRILPGRRRISRLAQFGWYWPQYQTQYARGVRRFEGQHSNTCVILGNGPSLTRTDLHLISPKVPVFGLNKIFLMPESTRPKIWFHVAVNPLVVEQSREQFSALTCPSFIPFHLIGRQTQPGEVPIWTLGAKGFRFRPDRCVSEGFTVTFVALQLALFFGFRRVLLVGVDHRFAFSGRPNETKFLHGHDPNHFHPGYFGNQQWNNPDVLESERSYRAARSAFESKRGEIVDCTVNGNLRVFRQSSLRDELEWDA